MFHYMHINEKTRLSAYVGNTPNTPKKIQYVYQKVKYCNNSETFQPTLLNISTKNRLQNIVVNDEN